MEFTWHKKRYEFYKLLDARFHDRLTPEEEVSLADITRRNAVQFILAGIERHQNEAVEQFLQENKDLFTLPFIQEIMSAASAMFEKNRGNSSYVQEVNATEMAVSKFLHGLRIKLYAPVSRTDRILSNLYRSIFRPLILIPARKIYRAVRSRASQ
jgi:hypothetical protein